MRTKHKSSLLLKLSLDQPPLWEQKSFLLPPSDNNISLAHACFWAIRIWLHFLNASRSFSLGNNNDDDAHVSDFCATCGCWWRAKTACLRVRHAGKVFLSIGLRIRNASANHECEWVWKISIMQRRALS